MLRCNFEHPVKQLVMSQLLQRVLNSAMHRPTCVLAYLKGGWHVSRHQGRLCHSPSSLARILHAHMSPVKEADRVLSHARPLLFQAAMKVTIQEFGPTLSLHVPSHQGACCCLALQESRIRLHLGLVHPLQVLKDGSRAVV